MAEPEASASQALRKLEDQLTCAICLDTYTEPKLLHCFHVYCKNCLKKLVVHGNDQGGAGAEGRRPCIRCPTCRKPTFLLASGDVSDLQSAYHIHNLFELRATLVKAKTPDNLRCQKCTRSYVKATTFCRDCCQFVCELCTQVHRQWKEFSDHRWVSIEDLESAKEELLPAPESRIMYCPQHKGKELDIYCDTCEELICLNCTIKKHKNHQYDLVSDSFDRHKAEIEASLKPIENHVSKLSKDLERLDKQSQGLDLRCAAGEAFVREQVDELHKMLDARRDELFKKVDKEVKAKLADLAAQKVEMEAVQSQLDSCVTFVTASLETGSEEEVMKIKNDVIKQINEVTANAEAKSAMPIPSCDLTDLRLLVSRELESAYRQFGDIQVVELTPDNIYAEGKGIKFAELGENTNAILRIANDNSQGTTFAVLLEIMTCELVSESTGQSTRCALKRTTIDCFEISYTPTQRGRHHLHIKIEDEHINGSPFSVTVMLPVHKLGTPVKTITTVKHPWGVASNARGDVIVADFSGHSISIFSPATGERLHSFSSCGKGRGQIYCPRGVAVDSDSNVLVVDGNHCIKKFTASGKFVASVGREGNNRMEFKRPTGIGVHPHTSKVYVTDAQNHRIQILNPDLSFCGMFNGGSGEGRLAYPWSVAFDSIGNVYVADSDNHFIQVYTPEGEYLRRFGGEGDCEGELNFPTSVCIDIDDMAYVTEYGNHRVSVFACDGHFLSSFGTMGTEPGQFNEPRCIVIDRDGFVIVTDCQNSSIQFF